MAARVIRPTARGFLHLDSHPDGCATTVRRMAAGVTPAGPPPTGRRPLALVVGSSSGYGLAATVAAIARHGMDVVGVCFEKGPTERRTATAGWYRTAATAEVARTTGVRSAFVNADGFADATKQTVLDLIEARHGQVDHLVYSIAAPRRTDPDTGAVYSSAIRPIGAPHRTPSLVFDGDGQATYREIEVPAATDDEIDQTVRVMGGADWIRWVDALDRRGLLGPDFHTVALSYIGSDLTAAIYRAGTIGAAKLDLERTARQLDERLTGRGRAATSVNGAAVTQSSAAIPGIGLYLGILRPVLGAAMRPPVDQLVELWDQLTGTTPLVTDDERRIRLDTWELDPAVQAEVARRWARAGADTLAELVDLDWFRGEVHRLYGWEVSDVDYDAPTEVDVAWPAVD